MKVLRREGESDLKVVDQFYVRVDGELINAAFVVLDTPANRELLRRYRDEYMAWRSLEPSVYELSNRLQRRPT